MIKTLNKSDTVAILASNFIGNLSYIYRGRPFVVPITYFYDKNMGVIISYSGEGHKVRAMRLHKQVSLGVSEINFVNSWSSVLAHGTFKELSGATAKAQLHLFSLGIKDLIIHKERRKLDFINEFSSKIENDDLPIVFEIKVEELTGKMRNN